MNEVVVHPRVMERHPELSEDDVREAWDNYVCMARRDNDQVLTLGFDAKSRAVEMVAKESSGDFLIYHAMTPPTRKAMIELGLVRR